MRQWSAAHLSVWRPACGSESSRRANKPRNEIPPSIPPLQRVENSKLWTRNPLGMPGHNKEPMPCEVNCRVHRVNTEDRIKQPGLQLPIHAALEVWGGGLCLSSPVCVNLVFLTIASLRRESWCFLQCRGREGESIFFRGECLPQIEESLWMQSSRGCAGNYTAMGCYFSPSALENWSFFFFFFCSRSFCPTTGVIPATPCSSSPWISLMHPVLKAVTHTVLPQPLLHYPTFTM